jgi:hypothetical protein
MDRTDTDSQCRFSLSHREFLSSLGRSWVGWVRFEEGDGGKRTTLDSQLQSDNKWILVIIKLVDLSWSFNNNHCHYGIFEIANGS